MHFKHPLYLPVETSEFEVETSKLSDMHNGCLIQNIKYGPKKKKKRLRRLDYKGV